MLRALIGIALGLVLLPAVSVAASPRYTATVRVGGGTVDVVNLPKFDIQAWFARKGLSE